MVAPVMKLLSGDARKTIESAISSMVPTLFIGVLEISSFIRPADMAFARRGVSTYPGQMALMRIPMSAKVLAS